MKVCYYIMFHSLFFSFLLVIYPMLFRMKTKKRKVKKKSRKREFKYKTYRVVHVLLLFKIRQEYVITSNSVTELSDFYHITLCIQADNNQEQQRAKHQKELLKRTNDEAKERLLNQKGAVAKEKFVLHQIDSFSNILVLKHFPLQNSQSCCLLQKQCTITL